MKALYMNDSYLKGFEGVVKSVKDDKYIVLDQTVFYPQGGGVACDAGVIIREGVEFPVVFVGKLDGDISHEVSEPGLREGDKIRGKISWERRNKLMRLHTAAHLLSSIFHNKGNAKITGNNIDVEKSRIDFNLEDFDREKISEYVSLANELIKKGMPVRSYFMKKEIALKIPDLIKLANKMPPDVDELRIVEIEGIDKQADGGCHVKNLKEIGPIEIVKLENKGKSNRRLYFMVG